MAETVKARFRSIKLLKTEPLGNGSYGMVYKAECDGLMCAAKLLHLTIVSQRNSQNFDQECRILSAIKHPNVIQYLGTYQDPETQHQALIMELMDESLTSFLERADVSGRAPLPLHVQLNICLDIALALKYLHQNDIIHRDLSSNNVLTFGGKRFKVTDFGMSKLISSRSNVTSMTQCPGCPAYMSPESLETPPVYSTKLDTFSFGVLTIQIITCKFPDPSPPKKKVRDPKYPAPIEISVFDVERRKSHIDLIPPTHPLLEMVYTCLSYQEQDRLTAEQCCDCISRLKLNQVSERANEDKAIEQTTYVIKTATEIASLKREIELLRQEKKIIEKENANAKVAELKPSWVISRDEIQISDQALGRGGFCIVFLAMFHDLKVAVKQLHGELCFSSNRDLFIRQMHILASLRHPNIIQFIGGVVDKSGMIVTELMSATLRQVCEENPLVQAGAQSIGSDVALALNHLHLITPDPILHLDVCSSNVLLTPSASPYGWKAKLAGFRVACYLSQSDTSCPGSPYYNAPESCNPKLHSPKTDVFSFGVLLLEMCTGEFPDSQHRDLLLHSLKWKAMTAIIKSCTQKAPQHRPTMKEIVLLLSKLDS